MEYLGPSSSYIREDIHKSLFQPPHEISNYDAGAPADASCAVHKHVCPVQLLVNKTVGFFEVTRDVKVLPVVSGEIHIVGEIAFWVRKKGPASYSNDSLNVEFCISSSVLLRCEMLRAVSKSLMKTQPRTRLSDACHTRSISNLWLLVGRRLILVATF